MLFVAIVLYAAVALPWPPRRLALYLFGVFIAAGVLALGAQAVAPPIGLNASYWAAAAPSGPPERSTDFPWLTDATRIDSSLDLRGEDFAVHFFNDASRFNFGADVMPARDQLPFSVQWDGFLVVPSSGLRRFVVEATGPVEVWLDEAPLPSADGTVNLEAGAHRLKVTYARPEARVPALRVQWQRDPRGPLVTLGGDEVRWLADDASALPSRILSGLAAVLGVAALAIWLVLALLPLVRSRQPEAWWRASLGLVPLVFLVYGALLEGPAMGKATILSGLDDWLIYESSARDILLNGLLMDGGQGHAAPFYGQPLYPYALALLHRLTGESLFGPLVVQFAALGLVAVGTAVLARRCFGSSLDGLAAGAAFLILLQVEPEHFKIARQLFNENLYMPLVMASLIGVVTLARREALPKWWQAVLVGALLGATAIARSQFLLFVPFGLLVLWLAWRRPRSEATGTTEEENLLLRREAERLAWRKADGVRATAAAALVAVGVLLAIAPVTARNWIVSGQFVPISSSGGASLLEFHRPPPGLLDVAQLQNDALSNALHLDESARTVLAFARKDAGGYLKTLLPLGAHSVGLQGRNDPGVYWPLLATCLVYAASFLLRRTRRLHVWPVHAFVGTHLLILMLFEADTYGYRLVMPMYAPMVAVAAQIPLELIRRVLHSPTGGALRSGQPARAARFAVAGWGVLALGALFWQAGTLVQAWPEREPALHGLGGAAAHAALTADRVGAEEIYVASVDGTPRRFGAGTLPGLRYPWLKWFDPLRSLPLPPASESAVYVLSELRGQSRPGDLTACLGAADASGEVVANAQQVVDACAAGVLGATQVGATFDGLARIEAVSTQPTAAAGTSLEARLVWQPLAAHPEPRQLSLQLDDPASADGSLWGNGTLEVYPAQEWQTDEQVLSRVPVQTDGTAIPQAYRLSVGMSPVRSNQPPDLASWQGGHTDRVPVGTVVLTPGSVDQGAALPADMRPVEGPPLVGGGLELIATRPLPSEAAAASPLRIGLLWKAIRDAPSATQVRVRLVGDSGDVLQETELPLLGGRVAPSALHEGNVVRDEQSFVVSTRLSGERVSLELGLEDAWQRLGSLNLTGRAHEMDTSGVPALATFGGAMDLLAAAVEPASAHSGEKITVRLRWRDAAAMTQAYKVFVHVLDPTGQSVVTQRDADPMNGEAPTTSWVVGEVLADEYQLTLPPSTASGDYPIELGVYDPRSGERLTLGNGANHLVLDKRLAVR